MFGNTSLKPEKSTSYDIGLERKISENTTAKLNYFQTLTTDLIIWDYDATTFLTTAKNIGEVRSEGVEFELGRKLGERGRAFINFTYQKAIDQKDSDPLAIGKNIVYTPQTKYNAGLLFGDSTILVKHVGERYSDGHNLNLLSAYTVVDFKLAKKMLGVGFTLAIDNLFDEVYSEAVGNDPVTFAARKYPMPGRRYSLQMQWDL
jgi:outer membrane receptor protein involved in Fe transport